METDNEWHDAILYQHSDDGCFILADSIEVAMNDPRPVTQESGMAKFQVVKINWNHGQPIVDCGDFKLSVVDVSFLPASSE